METWLWIAVALVAGAVLGAAVALLLARRSRGDQESVRRLRKEIDGYKQEVGEHFVETAELVNNLTRSYKAVYDHLEHGAYRLVGEETLRRKLDDVESEPVRLEYIGRRDSARVLGPGYASSTEGESTSAPGPAESPGAATSSAAPVASGSTTAPDDAAAGDAASEADHYPGTYPFSTDGVDGAPPTPGATGDHDPGREVAPEQPSEADEGEESPGMEEGEESRDQEGGVDTAR